MGRGRERRAMARKRRAGREAGGAQAAERSDAPRCGLARDRREPPAKGAQRPSHGGGRPRVWLPAPASEARSEQRERRRQGSSPEGRRPRQRASWSRAGRSRARRNRARRPVPGPGGRTDHVGGREGDIGSSLWTTANGPRRDAGATRRKHCGVGYGSREIELTSVRRRRVSAEPDARPRFGGVGHGGGAGSASGAGAKRRAAKRDTGHGAKKRGRSLAEAGTGPGG